MSAPRKSDRTRPFENETERRLAGLMTELRQFLVRRGVDAHVAAKRNERGDQVIGIILESSSY